MSKLSVALLYKGKSLPRSNVCEIGTTHTVYEGCYLYFDHKISNPRINQLLFENFFFINRPEIQMATLV